MAATRPSPEEIEQSMRRGRLGGLLNFVRWLADQGYIADGTARSWRSAVRRVLNAAGPSPVGPIRELDVNEIVELFKEMDHEGMDQATVDTYASRFKTAFEAYCRYLADPDAYDGPEASQARSREARRAGNVLTHRGGAGFQYLNQAAEFDPAVLGLARYPFPLENGGTAYVEVPRDLTRSDATRLAVFVQGLVVEGPVTDRTTADILRLLNLLSSFAAHEAAHDDPGSIGKPVAIHDIPIPGDDETPRSKK